MNKILSKRVYSNFVPNFKSLATIYQIFNEETPIKKRILMEESLLSTLTNKISAAKENLKPIDNIVYNTFVDKFNQEYIGKLLSEQKVLLNKYITSFVDNGIELKVYLNEEIGRLKKETKSLLNDKDVSSDSEMKTKIEKVSKMLNGFKGQHINEGVLKQIIKIQELTRESQKQ